MEEIVSIQRANRSDVLELDARYRRPLAALRQKEKKRVGEIEHGSLDS